MAKRLFHVRRTKSETSSSTASNDLPYRRISAKDILMGRVSDPAIPSLPDRSWRTNTSKPVPQLPPDLPSSKPDLLPPSKKLPELPPEPPLPSRPAPVGSPVGQKWYHSNLDRKRAEAILKKYSKDGTFIVRDSARVAGEYSLSLWFGGGIRHLRIRIRHDKKFVLGEEKSDEHAFDTVTELIASHRHDPIHLKSGGETTLKYECPQ